MGVSGKEKKSVALRFNASPALKTRLETVAEKRDTSVARLIRQAVVRYLDQEESK